MVGDTGVGKTTLTTRYLEQPFSEKVVGTTSPVFVPVKVTVDNEEIDLEIWDTAGQEQYRSLMSMYYRGASVAMLCFTKERVDSLRTWIEAVKQVEPYCSIVLVLTKSDLLNRDEIEQICSDVKQLSGVAPSGCIVTSAKTNEGVAEAFETVARSSPKQKRTKFDVTQKESNKGFCSC